jgi:NAD+ synthase
MTKDISATNPLAIDTDAVRDALTAFLAGEFRTAGCSRAVIGLSGGVDSALAAFLTVRALGADAVLGVFLPYRTSSPASRAHGELVASALGIRTELVEITPMVDAYLERYGIADRVRAGNVMARQRMIVLYDLSAREHALVVGTGNRTETLLGYSTLHGDAACALNPLGDLYKSQVWQLAAALGVPAEVVEKRPSADLWEGQTDEGEMGFAYRDVDRLLVQMVDEGRGDEELALRGFDAAFVADVRGRIARNAFKRRLPPVGLLPRGGTRGFPGGGA